jgi:hypothetical protein
MSEGERTHTTSSFGSMSFLSRIADRTAPPSLPVALVRAIVMLKCVRGNSAGFNVYDEVCERVG